MGFDCIAVVEKEDVERNDDIVSELESLIRSAPTPGSPVSWSLDYEEHNMALARVLDYTDNYTKKALAKIAGYYNLPTKRLSKSALVESIIEFESADSNAERVARRLACWEAVEILQADPHMKRYVIFDTV